ncbi:hypothetical protein [Cryptosporangium aurantiacum]|uniref:Uncharacterized protein n=1 Tax=Cryptosporangium aurantiacum TaxID=134849 RepID=A0A1M7RMH1_9ACTN|nr:hypothetical protein [Cryptosporangium aurantiacum]SHN47380.1 hypothetical protein SAMN05443668_12326 [Cryptosporangium aurantiacum]
MRTQVSADEVARAAAGRPCWTVRRSVFRRALRQLRYANEATGVAFTLDPVAAGLHVRLNLARPSFYGLEAVGEVFHLAEALRADVLCADDAVDADDLMKVWLAANAEGWDVAEEAGAEYATIETEPCLRWWRWQRNLPELRAEFDGVAWLPSVTLLMENATGRAVRLSTWAEGQAEALPDVDYVLYLASVERPTEPVAIPAAVVRELLDDLLVRTLSTDGVEVPYVPVAADAVARERAAGLAADHSPLAADAYRMISPAQLCDQPE